MLDLEDRVINGIRTGDYRKLYSPENFLVDTQGGGAGNNWASGYGQAKDKIEVYCVTMSMMAVVRGALTVSPSRISWT